MKTIGLTISIDYSDYLACTIKHNRSLFDRYYIGTTSKDTATIELANQHDATVIFFDNAVKADGATFNKSGIIHQMQIIAHTNHSDNWMLIHDSDCIIYLDAEEINDNTKLYGVTRLNYPTYRDYTSDRSYKYYHHGHGYFQLYYQKHYIYDHWSMDCGYCDIGFRSLWKGNYVLLQNSSVEHLGPPFVNWQGRKTPTWRL